MKINGRLKTLFDHQEIEKVIEYCRNNNYDKQMTHSVLKAYRERYNISVKETDRIRNRVRLRNEYYKTDRAKEYVKNRHRKYNFMTTPEKLNRYGKRLWEVDEYKEFLMLQEKGCSEVIIAEKLSTSLVMVKYLRLKRRLAMKIIEKQGKKITKQGIIKLMGHGELTLKKMLNDVS